MADKTNLLPLFNSGEWRASHGATIDSVTEDEIQITFPDPAGGHNPYVYFRTEDKSLQGKSFNFGYEEFTSSDKARIRLRCDDDYLVISENDKETISNYEESGQIPSSMDKLTLYIQPNNPTYPLTVSIKKLYLDVETNTSGSGNSGNSGNNGNGNSNSGNSGSGSGSGSSSSNGGTDNLLPAFNSGEWEAVHNMEIKSSTADSITMTFKDPAGGSNPYLRYQTSSDNLKGKWINFGYEEFTSSDKARIRLRCDDEYLVVSENGGGTLTNYSEGITIPSDMKEVRIYVQTDGSKNYPFDVTIKGMYLCDGTVGAIEGLQFHKVRESCVPTKVTPGEDHVYFALNKDKNNAKMYISAIDGNLIPVAGSGGSLQVEYNNPYTQAHINSRIDEIITLQNERHVSFLQITDIHIQDTEDTRFNQLWDAVQISKQIPLDFIAVTGDLISNPEDVGYEYDTTRTRLRMIHDILSKANCPVYYTRGNHDYNFKEAQYDDFTKHPEHIINDGTDVITTNRDWYNWIGERMDEREKHIVVDEKHPMSAYFYVDNPVLKYRLIFLNDFEYFGDERGQALTDENGDAMFILNGARTKHQVQWLVDKALDMSGKEDYKVFFFSHRVPYIDDDEFHAYGRDNEPLRKLVKAFKQGYRFISSDAYGDSVDENDNTKTIGCNYRVYEVPTTSGSNFTHETLNIDKNFSEQGEIDVIGWFSGHIHDDCYKKVDDINLCVSNCSCASKRDHFPDDDKTNRQPPERDETDKAMSLNLFITDYNYKKEDEEDDQNHNLVKWVNRIKLGVGEDLRFYYKKMEE